MDLDETLGDRGGYSRDINRIKIWRKSKHSSDGKLIYFRIRNNELPPVLKMTWQNDCNSLCYHIYIYLSLYVYILYVLDVVYMLRL